MAAKTGKLINCEYCGNEVYKPKHQLENKTHHFCTHDCYSLWLKTNKNPQRIRQTLTCKQCDCLFEVKNYMSKERKGKNPRLFCSLKCSGVYKTENYKPQKSEKYNKKCTHCGNNFLVWKHRYEDAKFCSKKCHYDSKNLTKECQGCHKEFTFPQNEGGTKRKYCSHKCASENIVYNSSVAEKEILTYIKHVLNFSDTISNKGIYAKGNMFKPDILVNKKYIIEYYGDYWHCSKTMFEDGDYNSSIHKTAKEKRETDKERENLLIDEGYELLIIWEHEYNKSKIEVLLRINNFLGVTQ